MKGKDRATGSRLQATTSRLSRDSLCEGRKATIKVWYQQNETVMEGKYRSTCVAGVVCWQEGKHQMQKCVTRKMQRLYNGRERQGHIHRSELPADEARIVEGSESSRNSVISSAGQKLLISIQGSKPGVCYQQTTERE